MKGLEIIVVELILQQVQHGSNVDRAQELKRAKAMWKLFEQGIYETPGGEILDPAAYTGGGSGSFLDIAKWCMDYVSGKLPEQSKVFEYDQGQHDSFPPSNVKNNPPGVDCSCYVSWVISKYTGKDNESWDTGALMNNPMNFEVVPHSGYYVTEADLQPGDIVVWRSNGKGHTEIYAGNGWSYSCGSTGSIKDGGHKYNNSKFTKAFRAPAN